jgi:hypothetical protein
MEQFTTIISSRGLLKSTGAHNGRPVSSQALIDADLLVRHRPGSSIYVCSDALPEFASRLMPQLQAPFTLVSGDSDLSIAPSTIGDAVFRGILENPLCTAWFAQNAQAEHAKLHSLPIGLDYHTMWEYPGRWGLSAVAPMAQERQLLDTWARSPELPQRYLAAYCNWTHALDRGDRRECLERIDGKIRFTEQQFVPRASSWARQSECLFVVSPEGAGMDCHRTWEAFLLGCIPIVKRNALAPLLAKLPTLIVDDWAEVRRDNLERHLAEIANKTFDFSILFRDTWVRRIHGHSDQAELPVTLADFRKLMVRATA